MKTRTQTASRQFDSDEAEFMGKLHQSEPAEDEEKARTEDAHRTRTRQFIAAARALRGTRDCPLPSAAELASMNPTQQFIAHSKARRGGR